MGVSELVKALDMAHERFLGDDYEQGMDGLVNDLARLRKEAQNWAELIDECRRHPVCQVLLQDPLTRRSLERPRGYAGDAVMLDIIYRHPALREDFDNQVCRYTSQVGRSPQAVRHRRSLIARTVDDLSVHNGALRVLSIASGHLREAELSRAFTEGHVAEWVALDQDDESLSECRASYRESACIRTVKASVRDILSRKVTFQGFDFVYAAGLFDYLSASTAQALLSRMFAMTKDGGQVLIANFRTGFVDAGYMEAFMDWHLTYRDEADVHDLFAGLTTDVMCTTDSWDAIIYGVGRKLAPV